MTLHEALIVLLLADATGVVEQLGQADGVFEARAPRDAKRPYVIVHGVGGNAAHFHLGGPCAFEMPLTQVECYADSVSKVVDLANAVDARINGYRGRVGDEETGLWVNGAFRRDRRGPLPEDAQDGSERPVFSVHLDYAIGHRT